MNNPTDLLHISFERRTNNYQPNVITESKQEFTEMEKKIVVLAINQLRSVAQAWKPGQNITLLIPYSELTNRHHTKISAAANTLTTKRIIHQSGSNPKIHEFDFMVPFPRVKSTKIQGKRYLELLMLSEVVPAFIELGKRYTSYSLQCMLSLSSVYAKRMYEIIMMFYGRGQKEFIYEVSKLRFALNYPLSHDYYDFKRKAIQVAQQEMQQKIGMHFDFVPSRKQGKSVVELRFAIKSAQDVIDEAIEFDRLSLQTLSPPAIAALARNLIHTYRFSKQQQNQILEDFSLMDTFIRLHTEIYHGKRVVKNATAYIAQSLGFGKSSPKARSGAPNQPTVPRTPTIKPISDLMTLETKPNKV